MIICKIIYIYISYGHLYKKIIKLIVIHFLTIFILYKKIRSDIMELFIFYGLTIISLLITLGAQAFISSSYNKYTKVKLEKNITGQEVARQILDKHGLNNVNVLETDGYLTDHYDPKNKLIKLSKKIYGEPTVAAVSLACHECGHAIQDKTGYTFLRVRAFLVPFVNFFSVAGYIAIIIGSLLSAFGLIVAGIIAEMVLLLFQLITLPVEFNASKRGLKELQELNIVNSNELNGGKVMLTSAALTYVASLATTVIQIIRLILIYGNNRRD